MAKANDRVKEGRSRVGLLIDDDLLDPVDRIAAMEHSSRSKILLFLITEGLKARGLWTDPLNYPEYPDYWVECMMARPQGSFFKGRLKFSLIDESKYEDTFDRDIYQEEGFPDELSDRLIERCMDNGVISETEHSQIQRTREEIQVIRKKYSDMMNRLYQEYEEEQRRLEQLIQQYNSTAKVASGVATGKSAKGKK